MWLTWCLDLQFLGDLIPASSSAVIPLVPHATDAGHDFLLWTHSPSLCLSPCLSHSANHVRETQKERSYPSSDTVCMHAWTKKPLSTSLLWTGKSWSQVHNLRFLTFPVFPCCTFLWSLQKQSCTGTVAFGDLKSPFQLSFAEENLEIPEYFCNWIV